MKMKNLPEYLVEIPKENVEKVVRPPQTPVPSINKDLLSIFLPIKIPRAAQPMRLTKRVGHGKTVDVVAVSITSQRIPAPIAPPIPTLKKSNFFT